MSNLAYAQRPRFGQGWPRAVVTLLVVGLIAVCAWSVYRIATGLAATTSGAPAASVEERIVSDALEAVQQNPSSAEAHWRLSIALSTIGDFAKASTEAEGAILLDKSKVEPYYALGVAYRGLKDPARAEKAFVKAASVDGATGDVYKDVFYDLGQVRLELGDSEGAVKAFESALANGPEATYIVVALADSYRQTGNVKRAKEEYLAVLGYDPSNAEAAKALKELGVSEAIMDQARKPIAHETPAAE